MSIILRIVVLLVFMTLLCETSAFYTNCHVVSILKHDTLKSNSFYITSFVDMRVVATVDNIEHFGYLHMRTGRSYASMLRELDKGLLKYKCWLSEDTKIIYESHAQDPSYKEDTSHTFHTSDFLITVVIMVVMVQCILSLTNNRHN
ncbi:hypothetical protein YASMINEVIRUS_952 [Yasminevirus sp. GU-2018]|uniref:Uncharacterized protein n=1 Tax=Yasminevirus sp. GU-2018 TaxID=2420051 RepID=A0A5K0U8L7_9VIRU|nr:hypothetical protein YASMINEVIRUS_952 [Yasminevirus sp. GU-2018]